MPTRAVLGVYQGAPNRQPVEMHWSPRFAIDPQEQEQEPQIASFSESDGERDACCDAVCFVGRRDTNQSLECVQTGAHPGFRQPALVPGGSLIWCKTPTLHGDFVALSRLRSGEGGAARTAL